ncbi:MAG: hypothetical protein ABS68_14125 [Niastella sp. SCN 39-18]|nr:hypothetical protein [Sphingobacteriales bacterium]ODT49359.1 MAG: hypothetical protein ABS68_14125 [Niastella sp. SCN 39-18]OJW10968.1 MAG: hypothetical protein BGO53_01205 [Sphingobacteriales bacterium 39-19]
MEDRFSKYIKLTTGLMLTVIGFVLSIAILLVLIRLLFGILSYVPWISYFFMACLIIFPSIFFITVFYIYYKRTRLYPRKWIRYLSFFIFCAISCFWMYVLIKDVITFTRYQYTEIDKYMGFGMWLLAGSVFTLFLVGMMQALGQQKELDWRTKRQQERGDVD